MQSHICTFVRHRRQSTTVQEVPSSGLVRKDGSISGLVLARICFLGSTQPVSSTRRCSFLRVLPFSRFATLSLHGITKQNVAIVSVGRESTVNSFGETAGGNWTYCWYVLREGKKVTSITCRAWASLREGTEKAPGRLWVLCHYRLVFLLVTKAGIKLSNCFSLICVIERKSAKVRELGNFSMVFLSWASWRI